jgi:colanic acid/amylovoran biosynthesis glycosyltransferase
LRLAVFTNQFPGRVNTFFSRDIRALLEAGFDIDVFPFYPIDPTLWRYVPDILGECVFSRTKVYHVGLLKSLTYLRPWPLQKVGMFVRDIVAISTSATRFGVVPLAKSMYVFPKAWAWNQKFYNNYDHIIAYWGNYAATCAYIFHRLMDRSVPFSMFLHAGIDLYQDQVYLRQKLLYADNIIVVCDFNRRFIEQRYTDIYPLISDRIHEYHPGLDFSAFPYQPNGRPAQKILAVGVFAKYKGFEYLLRAAYELSRRGLNYELELIGDGKEASSLKALAKDLSISERVRFPGWLAPEEVRAAMAQATILVHPSNGLGDAVPTVIKESMALGTPVIASNIVGIPELLDHGRCGMLVPLRNPIALANAIETLLTSYELRRRYADSARKYAEEKFDLWRNGQQLAALLCSTTRGKIPRLDFGQPSCQQGTTEQNVEGRTRKLHELRLTSRVSGMPETPEMPPH